MLALVPGVSRSGATIIGGLAMRLDRAAAAEFSFFVAIPTMFAASAHEFLEVRSHLTSARALEILVGFTMAFLSSLLIIKPFLGFVRRAGFAPFAWYRIALGPGAGCRHLGRMGAGMIQWLRRRFVTGFFVLVPLVDQLRGAGLAVRRRRRVHGIRSTSAFSGRATRRCRRGLGIVTTAAVVLLVGVVATNVLGKRVLQRAEGYLLRIPVFRTVYAPGQAAGPGLFAR